MDDVDDLEKSDIDSKTIKQVRIREKRTIVILPVLLNIIKTDMLHDSGSTKPVISRSLLEKLIKH